MDIDYSCIRPGNQQMVVLPWYYFFYPFYLLTPPDHLIRAIHRF